MKTNAAPRHFSGHNAIEANSPLGFVECVECLSGVAADIVLIDCGAYCVECLPAAGLFAQRALANPARWVEAATDAGRAFLKGIR